MKDIYQLMTNHRSIRKYKEQEIPKTDLDKILNAAIHCPSSVNGQQFSIIVIKDKAKKDKIAELAGGQQWIAQAPVFLVFVADFYRVSQALKERDVVFANGESIENTLVGAVDCGLAFGNAMNMAESMGYGIVPIGAVRREPIELIEMLQLPPYVFPIVGMCIGVPDEMPMLKPRLPMEVMVHEETYHKDNQELIDQYNQIIKEYMTKRTDGQDVRDWGHGVSSVYKKVYYPKVKEALNQQGFTNVK